ncbi:leucyl/phenylalanyl-tRNA--protein transferase [Desulforegula conservatrix]|uniref:leucyl/phenylalanyl-tRNA--protein transferase n=1 Tax=Desulforegula conservatrix TaxID=153026 RepID=UPI0003F854CB|nr:leucyl/phenylalanyl-tRNA--protein transferase [Desulforegula conservatrix]
MPVFYLSENKQTFPPPFLADQTGLLAVGGDLSVQRLITAYSSGIFPWYNEDEPILWWSPDPRLVLFPDEIHISRSLAKAIRKNVYEISVDKAFKDVITKCRDVHTETKSGTWLVDEMLAAYVLLHELGYAHSVEAWKGEELVGGLYGVSIGKCFFGESMFSTSDNSSKVAFAVFTKWLAKMDFEIIDCQVATKYLSSFGAREIPRKEFLGLLEKTVVKPGIIGRWTSLFNEEK